MPKGIKDENIWNDAIKAFKKQYNKEPKTSQDFATVTAIYKKMNGKFEKMEEMLEQFNTFQENNNSILNRLNKLMERI